MSGSCQINGWETLLAAWRRYERDEAFREHVEMVRHSIEHLIWPTGEDGLEMMFRGLIAVALQSTDPEREQIKRAMEVLGADSAATALTVAASKLDHPESAITLLAMAQSWTERANQLRSRP
jgi:hypothetical protein